MVAGEQGVAVEGLGGQALELPDRVEALREGADVREPVGDRELMSVLLVDLAPGSVGARLGIDQQPVEVEEQAADVVGWQRLEGWSVTGGPTGIRHPWVW